ncbi:CaiB/BaiF CoA transferase family protein [Tropicimonas isoalkanivorans]|uniref:Crotonobetainyl-CoA:carnitine CoA-transferase CaiB n=1 Tax=Tropicimonas isoalkanivorans TaxID=441112 RepID=A0A1I1HTX2_9RHOB|nr:CaiB/BaiF CoA-transferase family protein [Tropicimonas isoalkanivorans]SFC27346.1 Crotonobetainyl-CoA:carnitine CoA-transferase CaiB [Tropicimonas isoalkanivorans]
MGPLAGIKIVEIGSIGPGPMCAMVLADLGATVLRIERKVDAGLGIARPIQYNLLLRGRKQVAVDLKDPEGIAFVMSLVAEADGLIEGFRPGVTERLGLGPDDCLNVNPKLVYGRMTGWGQDGPLAKAAGHDLNYIAVTGALAAIGRKDQPPTPPLTLVGDLGGGALYLALGLLSGILEARGSGKGQVVDASIADGTAHLMTNFHGMLGAGLITTERGTNFSDGGAPYYDCYKTLDGKWISIAPIEPKFFALLVEMLGLGDRMPPQNDRARWPEMRALFETTFATKTRAEWCDLLEGTDTCFAPVLTMDEAGGHPHLAARGSHVEIGGVMQPRPAPRFSRTEPDLPEPPKAWQETSPEEALDGWEMTAANLKHWRARGVV